MSRSLTIAVLCWDDIRTLSMPMLAIALGIGRRKRLLVPLRSVSQAMEIH